MWYLIHNAGVSQPTHRRKGRLRALCKGPSVITSKAVRLHRRQTIGAISDILAQRQDWALERPSEVLEAFDTIPLGILRGKAVARRPWPVRATLRTYIYDRLESILDEPEQRLAV